MAEESKSFSWQTAIAIGGLLASLFGNWIQYQTVSDKRIELEQSQQKLDSLQHAEDERKANAERRRNDLQSRMDELQRRMEGARQEESRGLAGIVNAPPDQKPMAVQIVDAARTEESNIHQAVDKLQSTIDAANAACEK
jgi:CHASE3 domain sensor protein